MKLYEYQPTDYGALLAGNVLDATGELFQTQGLDPDPTNRTILIGIGGTGVRTVDYVKGEIVKRLNPNWKNYVAFLGMDSSWTELDKAMHLDQNEQLMYTEAGVAQRMGEPRSYPLAVHRFMPEGARLATLDDDGCGRTRLAGKVKIHDHGTGSEGVDEKIVARLNTVKTNLLSVANPGKYEVYVIGSACGGTCSGGFLELPALIRQVFPASQLHINGMLYLPDTLTSLDPDYAAAIQANGYATLKELNYYMGMYMRPDYEESWSYNNTANPVLKYRSRLNAERFMDIPYLIGTTNGASAKAFDEAKEGIAEFLISILAKISTLNQNQFLTSAFLSNAQNTSNIQGRRYQPNNPNLEAPGEFHEFPKRFAALGFAKETVPQQMIRAYEVGQLCEKAGIQSREPAEQAANQPGGVVQILPFRALNALMSVPDGTRQASELFEPLRDVLDKINHVEFRFASDIIKESPTWGDIKDSVYDSDKYTRKASTAVEKRTDSIAVENLKNQLKAAYQAFCKKVQNYVTNNGPFAFYNLYKGRFAHDKENPDSGIGIEKMLSELCDGKVLDSAKHAFTEYPFLSVAAAEEDLKDKRDIIHKQDEGLIIKPLLTREKRNRQAKDWENAYEAWIKAQVVENNKLVFLGAQGHIKTELADKAAILADQIQAFGHLLDSLSGIYQNFGKSMEDFERFRVAKDSESDVNLAGLNQSAYDWIKSKVDAAVAKANAKQFRDQLVKDFFENPDRWLEVPDGYVEQKDGGARLTISNRPIPARKVFDQIVNKVAPAQETYSIETIAERLKEGGQSYNQIAQSILQSLSLHGKLKFNGDISPDLCFSYIMYPSALQKSPGDGQMIAAALDGAAKSMFGDGVGIYASDDTDSIVYYQLATPLEVYRLADLKKWEDEYENGRKGLKAAGTYLHGMSPDVREEPGDQGSVCYKETMPWKDYPAIARQADDPRRGDPQTGAISREGQLRNKLDELIQRARELGVLYSAQDRDGKWIVKRVSCDKSVKWRFALDACTPDEKGYLPVGKGLASEVAQQNHKALEDLSRNVQLVDSGGLMEGPYETEAWAWIYAARVLRAHVPMYIEVRETLHLFEKWAAEIEEYNRGVDEYYAPGMMIIMVCADLLFRTEDGAWKLRQEKGNDIMVANLTEGMKKLLRPAVAKYINGGLLAYFLFQKLKSQLGGQEGEDHITKETARRFRQEFSRAKKKWDDLNNAGDATTLANAKTLADELLREIDQLKENGAHLDRDEDVLTPKPEYKKAYPGFNEKELKDIDAFYYRLKCWKDIS